MKPNYDELPLEAPAEGVPEDEEDKFITLRSSRKTRQNFIIVLLVVFLVMAILLVIVFVVLYGVSKNSSSESSSTSSPTPPPSDTICQTDACFDLSVQILASMDDTANPCTNFYNYTCGNWDIYQHIRPGLYVLSSIPHWVFSYWKKWVGQICI